MSAALILQHNNMLLTYRSIRKPMPPPTKIERPKRGRGYKRPRNGKEIYGDEE